MFWIFFILSQHSSIPVGNDTGPSPKYGYGTIQMSPQTTFYDVLDTLSPYGPINTTYPITMEQMQQVTAVKRAIISIVMNHVSGFMYEHRMKLL